jgi:hypothetical protein
MNHQITELANSKKEWARPELKRLEAGAAESTHNANSDGGGGNQGS